MMLPEHSGSHTLGRTPGPIPCKCCRGQVSRKILAQGTKMRPCRAVLALPIPAVA